MEEFIEVIAVIIYLKPAIIFVGCIKRHYKCSTIGCNVKVDLIETNPDSGIFPPFTVPDDRVHSELCINDVHLPTIKRAKQNYIQKCKNVKISVHTAYMKTITELHAQNVQLPQIFGSELANKRSG
jgi:hypothetical protein